MNHADLRRFTQINIRNNINWFLWTRKYGKVEISVKIHPDIKNWKDFGSICLLFAHCVDFTQRAQRKKRKERQDDSERSSRLFRILRKNKSYLNFLSLDSIFYFVLPSSNF